MTSKGAPHSGNPNWWKRDPTYASWTGVGGSVSVQGTINPGPRKRGRSPTPPAAPPKPAGPVNPYKNADPSTLWRAAIDKEQKQREQAGGGYGSIFGRSAASSGQQQGPARPTEQPQPEARREKSPDRRRRRSRSRSRSRRRRRSPSRSRSRRRRRRSRSRSRSPRRARSQEGGARRRGEGAEEVRRRMRAAGEWFDVPDPAFDDHDAVEFECEGCGERRPRSSFPREQLRKLSAPARPDGDSGPFRGRLVRVQAYKHFGFITSPSLPKAGLARDAFLKATAVERLLGGHHRITKLVDKGVDEFCRLQFWVDSLGDGRITAKDVSRIDLLCSTCARAREERSEGSPGRSSRQKSGAGFDPKEKISALGQKLKGV